MDLRNASQNTAMHIQSSILNRQTSLSWVSCNCGISVWLLHWSLDVFQPVHWLVMVWEPDAAGIFSSQGVQVSQSPGDPGWLLLCVVSYGQACQFQYSFPGCVDHACWLSCQVHVCCLQCVCLPGCLSRVCRAGHLLYLPHCSTRSQYYIRLNCSVCQSLPFLICWDPVHGSYTVEV